MARNCIIWPENTETERSPCNVHRMEMEKLGWGGEYNVKGHMFDNFFLLIDGTVEFGLKREDGVENVFPGLISGIYMKFHEVRRRGQPVDKGGYYLDPKILEDDDHEISDIGTMEW